jgi:UDP-glucose 4-epimerase
MVSEEECFRTEERNGYYAILPVLPELRVHQEVQIALTEEYSSKDNNLPVDKLQTLLGSASGEIAAYMAG